MIKLKSKEVSYSFDFKINAFVFHFLISLTLEKLMNNLTFVCVIVKLSRRPLKMDYWLKFLKGVR